MTSSLTHLLRDNLKAGDASASKKDTHSIMKLEYKWTSTDVNETQALKGEIEHCTEGSR